MYRLPSNHLRRLSTVAGVAALLGSVSTAALGAEQIETVVVTVERHAEDLQTVPESVATVNDDQLASIFQSGQDIRALASRVPSLYAESSNGRVAPRFYIRGLGNSDFDLAASQPVSIIEDDVVQENVVLKSAPLYDIQSIEVDRGPQGTLFGRNTTAGIIKFTTAKPTDTLSGYGSISYGELGTLNAEGAIGDAITDTLSFRVSGLIQHRDDYIDNAHLGLNGVLGGYDERAGRAQLEWKPSENFTALLNVHARSIEGTAAIFRANILTKGSNQLNGNYISDKVFFDQGFYDPRNENPQSYDGAGASLKMEYDFWGMKLTSITGYEATHGFSRGDIDGGFGAAFLPTMGPGFIPFPSDTQDGLTYLHQFTQELHLASDTGGRLFWQVGAFVFDTSYNDATNPFFVPPTNVHQSNQSWAGFAQASYAITDAFTLKAGVRYTSDVKGMTANGPLIFPGGVQPLVKLRGNNISWDVSGEYAVNQDINLYARVATGFRAPSIQGRNLAFGSGFSTARSETVTSYEAGIKTMLDDHRLRLNVDGFYYYLAHPQFSAIGGASNSVILLNAHGGIGYGLEADAEWLPTDNWDFTAGASWNHTAIHDTSLQVAPCGATPGASLASLLCTPLNTYTPATGGAFINGNPFPEAPEYVVNFTAKYTWPLESGAEIYAYTDWYLQGFTNFFLYKSAEYHTNGNYEGGLRIGYVFPNKDVEVALYARNLTDKANLQGGIDFNNLTGFVGDPRVIGVQLSGHL
ncbi:MAG: TonB-dependent receptor [Alphaproteobacteria bacterium]|nr:TonB-dependent receptor [Alphaproteobacteria bacterium]MBL7096247.1 TonB-dependent receptor [Alphaproteobacteria bacterium]